MLWADGIGFIWLSGYLVNFFAKYFIMAGNHDAVDPNPYLEVFFNYVEQIIHLPECDRELCRQTFFPVLMEKDTMLEYAGNIPRYHNFIVSGHMRNFHINEEGEEITVDLNDGPRFFTSYQAFVQQTVSNEYLHCITDCVILRISKQNADYTAGISLTQKDYSIKLFQQLLEEEKQRIHDFAHLTAEQRYLKLMRDKPAIIKNVPLKFIASYLGVQPESLARIRKGISYKGEITI